MKSINKTQDQFKRLTNYVRNNFDEGAILSSLISIAAKGGERSLTSDESIVLAALRRSAKKFEDASVEEIGEILNSYDDNQIPGLVNNVKGILFELEYVEIENSDGDSIFAYQFEQTNYPTYDVQLIDEQTGGIEEIQLKATSSASYVKNWMDEHGENIVVTDEVAEELGLDVVGINNEELENLKESSRKSIGKERRIMEKINQKIIFKLGNIYMNFLLKKALE